MIKTYLVTGKFSPKVVVLDRQLGHTRSIEMQNFGFTVYDISISNQVKVFRDNDWHTVEEVPEKYGFRRTSSLQHGL